jgi:hypothetical protein
VGGTCSTHEEERVVYRVLVGMAEGKRPLGRLSLCDKVTLRRILGDRNRWGRTGFGWLRVWSGGRPS